MKERNLRDIHLIMYFMTLITAVILSKQYEQVANVQTGIQDPRVLARRQHLASLCRKVDTAPAFGQCTVSDQCIVSGHRIALVRGIVLDRYIAFHPHVVSQQA